MKNLVKGKWRVIAGCIAIFAVFPCALILFHRFTKLGKHLTWDGYTQMWTTLGVGVLGFGAVLLQTRPSYRQLREQLDDQHRSAAEELERQKRAVATALLFEIDDFYRPHLRDVRATLACWSPDTGKLLGMSSVGESPFPVDYGNAGSVGSLPAELMEAVVHFYGVAGSILSYFRDHAFSEARARQLQAAISGVMDFQTQREHGSEQIVALQHLDRIKGALPETIKFTWMVCYKLCEFVGLPFEFPRIGVAAENLSMQQIEASPVQGVPADKLKEADNPDSFNAQTH